MSHKRFLFISMAHMLLQIEKITIHNILSYEDVTFTLKQNNVIVGPNNSGKSNILRILNMLKNIDFIQHLKMDSKSKHSDGYSLLSLNLLLTKSESRMLNSVIFRNPNVTDDLDRDFSRIQIVIKWSKSANDDLPAEVILRISNGITFVNHQPNEAFYTDKIILNENLIAVPTIIRGMRSKITSYQQIHKIHAPALFQTILYSPPFSNNIKSFFSIRNEKCSIPCNMVILPTDNREFIPQIFKFVDANMVAGSEISIFHLITKFLHKGLFLIEEMRPPINDFANMLFVMKNNQERDYEEIKSSFSKIFSGMLFEIRKGEQQKKHIIIHEREKEFPLEKSSAGYFQMLYILYQIHGKKGQSVFFDEPETHLHPNNIKKMTNYLNNYGKGNAELDDFDARSKYFHSFENQISLITHSPLLVTHQLLSDKTKELFYVNKQNSTSTVNQKSDNFIMDVKTANFRPQIFFGKCVILVEGITDEYAMMGLSARCGNEIEKNDIVLVNVGSKTQLPHYISLLSEYNMPYVAMADSDYEDNSRGVIMLKTDLEDELKSYGMPWRKDKNQKKEFKPEKIYDFMASSENDEKVKNGTIYKVMKKAVSLVDPVTDA